MRYVLALAALVTLAFAIFGYFDATPFVFREPASHRARYPLAAIYWSGDMGYTLGVGHGMVQTLLDHDIPVLQVSSPVLFGFQRDRPFTEQAMASSIREALARSGASRVALVGNSFGADMIGAAAGSLPADLRKRVASIVMVVPGTSVYFHANPTGIFYRGPGDSSPERTIPQLTGLPLTCIYGTDEDESLCREPVMRMARRIPLNSGHMMLGDRDTLYAAVYRAVQSPPPPMRRSQ
ncbi:alpha/beta fold hydrolase [Novosphingobium taihuense]|uniref:Type IV secretory pathway VirJ component n=1 Tax=Novosphingobium taihuense TaxID=260085 RepID=A0A7W7A7M1_9SPHN|nr:AcvB/VirJ family lysyl-phosphatidylglycerol hydrolase [Novosphingobium taihuense]MBB4611934.1 type IV secretory pathway VirJ component [Novosphingobium taihuense]TWH88713.1 virulence protein VirJ [Novosphingobium taihuense]